MGSWMESDSASLYQIKNGKLWLPFLLIIMGVIMALIALIYAIFYMDINQFMNSKSFNLIITIIFSLISPFIMTGIALFLLILIEPKKGAIAWSILIFFCGAVLFMISALLAIIMQYSFLYVLNWSDNTSWMINLSRAEMITNVLGILLCTLSGLYLVKAYLKETSAQGAPGQAE